MPKGFDSSTQILSKRRLKSHKDYLNCALNKQYQWLKEIKTELIKPL